MQEWGYEVELATNRAEALELLQRPDAPMLAILDWMMPGMDGTEVCKAIRESVVDRYIYLVVLTSRTETASIHRRSHAGADDFVTKPFGVDELQVRLRAGRRV